MIYRIKNAVIAVLILLCAQAGAASLSDIQVSNGEQQARITLSLSASRNMLTHRTVNGPWRWISGRPA